MTFPFPIFLPAVGDLPAAITGMKTWGSSDTGYHNNSPGTITQQFYLKASNTDPTGSGWTGTTIGTIASFANAFAAQPKETLGNANTTRYRYVWLEATAGGAFNWFVLTELEFYETIPGGSETLIDPTGKSIITDMITSTYPISNAFNGAGAGGARASVGAVDQTGSLTVRRAGLDLGAL